MRIVQKYGGSSVADVEKIRKVARRVAERAKEGHQILVVVSAMGNTTNELLALAKQLSIQPERRELDMLLSVGERITMALLAMALRDLGVPARSFTGSQSGIITDSSHASARVVELRPDRLLEALEAGEVVIVAGFQGMSREREVTTLGRGGSDTTAVVLAAAIQADECEICSDVDGIYSADPRLVSGTVRLDELSLDEALALARNGAKVLFEDAVAWAKREGISLRASASFSERPGSRIVPGNAPARVLALCRDEELGWLPLSALGSLPAPCIRHATADGLLIDRRNLHSVLDDMKAAATVAVVGSRAGQDPHILSQVLDAAVSSEKRSLTWWAAADAVVFRCAPEDAAALEQHLHRRLLSPEGSLR